jgi:hypothetical protein
MERYHNPPENQPRFSTPFCHRCQRPAPRRGRMSASVTAALGRVVRRLLCRVCVADPGSWRALAANAEAAERENRADRRVAA